MNGERPLRSTRSHGGCKAGRSAFDSHGFPLTLRNVTAGIFMVVRCRVGNAAASGGSMLANDVDKTLVARRQGGGRERIGSWAILFLT